MYILGGPPAHNFSTVVPNGIAWKPQAPHATEGLNMDPIKGGKNIFGPTIEAKIPSNWSFYLSHPHKSTKEIISSTYFTPVHHGGHHGGACLKLDRKLCSVCFILVDSGGQCIGGHWTVGSGQADERWVYPDRVGWSADVFRSCRYCHRLLCQQPLLLDESSFFPGCPHCFGRVPNQPTQRQRQASHQTQTQTWTHCATGKQNFPFQYTNKQIRKQKLD